MTILIFGGTGLIGCETVLRLADMGETVVVSARRAPDSGPLADATGRFAFVPGDITDAGFVRDAVDRIRPRHVVHLAAMLIGACEKDPVGAVRVNVDGTVNILEASAAYGVGRVVFGSSIAVYGGGDGPFAEDSPPNAPSVYGASKRLAEVFGARYARQRGLGFVALRYSGVIGPGAVMSEGMALVRERIKSTMCGEPVTIDSVGGDERFHLTYVADAADATIRAMNHPAPRHSVYNVAGPDANFISLRDFHAAVRRVWPDAGDVTFTGGIRGGGRIATARMREDLGFVPRFSVEDGLCDEKARMVQRPVSRSNGIS